MKTTAMEHWKKYIVIIKHLEIVQMSALNNPLGVEILPDSRTKQIENIDMIIIKHLVKNQILALNNPIRSWYAIKQKETIVI